MACAKSLSSLELSPLIYLNRGYMMRGLSGQTPLTPDWTHQTVLTPCRTHESVQWNKTGQLNQSQFTDTRHDTWTSHSIVTLDTTHEPVTVQWNQTWHMNQSQYRDTRHNKRTSHRKLTPDMPHERNYNAQTPGLAHERVTLY